MGLNEANKQSLAGWLGQTLTFYTKALGDRATSNALACFNVTREDLEHGLALVQAVAELDSAEERET